VREHGGVVIGEALGAATAELDRAGVRNPRREATAIWAALAGTSLGEVWLDRDGETRPGVAAAFREAVERRSHGMPLPYAVGRASFRTLDLKIDPRALIPRPETEGLVELVLEWGRGEGGGGRGGIAADIGTGSGCIALALAVEGRFDGVIAVERNPLAAALARENVALLAAATPVEVREGDLLAPLTGTGKRYRAIVSNPPYLTCDEYEALDAAVRRYEPAEALVSGLDGLEATRRLLAWAGELLEPRGALFLEIDERRGDVVRNLAQEQGWRRIEIREDLFGRPRYAVMEGEGE
jgi:release factor glutamine methyltransferase